MINALTVDVEEYFHPNAMDDAVQPDEWEALPHRVEHNTQRILDLLGELDVRATFFVLGWVAERWPSLVREIARRGHEVASHGYAHRLVYKLGPEGFRDDVRRGKRVLEDALGRRVLGFRSASWSIIASTLWAFDILIEEGFEYDSSIFPVHHDIYGIPGFSRFPVKLSCGAGEILEIPPSTVRLLGNNWPVAGGGYFRLFPYALTRWAIARINARDNAPAMVYVHPWELDSGQPRLPAKWTTRLRQYANLDATELRLRRLVADFDFAPIGEAMASMCAAAPRVCPTMSSEAAGLRTHDLRSRLRARARNTSP
jgi:polysaccharide deacetylase family protein (PEP-CTERM system associated)